MQKKVPLRLRGKKPPSWWRQPAKRAFFSLAASSMLIGGLCARPDNETLRLAAIVAATQKCARPEEKLYLYPGKFALGWVRINWVDSRCYRPEVEVLAQRTRQWPPGGNKIYIDPHLTP